MAAFLLTSIALLLLFVIRNELTYRMRMAATDVLETLIGTDDFEIEFDRFKAASYESMMFDLRKWTFKQFYPSLAGRA